ncbi:thioredoxin-disulfide reductase [Candidatus Saccharibacteria bacterium]|nr:thioredoxin-disulfide reductase [Candidatus Saccharibacteria bacterium]
MIDVIIIGAGPAGLTAAIYALRAGKKVLVLEGKAYGGQIINAQLIENYPGVVGLSGVQLATNMYNQVKDLGGEVKFEQVSSIEDGAEKKVRTDEGEYRAKAIIVATGAENRKLGLEREAELTGKGVSYCATCDGHFYKGKDVAVIGGGNTALQDAIYLANLANKVYVIHRRDEFRGEHAYVEELKKKQNVKFVLKANADSLEGDSKLEAVVVKDADGNLRELPVSGVFIAVGYVPQNQIFEGILALDEEGYIDTQDGVHTNKELIYVAGDARAKELKQLTTAVSDGSIAADTAVKEMK